MKDSFIKQKISNIEAFIIDQLNKTINKKRFGEFGKLGKRRNIQKW